MELDQDVMEGQARLAELAGEGLPRKIVELHLEGREPSAIDAMLGLEDGTARSTVASAWAAEKEDYACRRRAARGR